jgi:hypothetical protein
MDSLSKQAMGLALRKGQGLWGDLLCHSQPFKRFKHVEPVCQIISMA